MSDRFEIIDEGSQIRILSPDDGSISTIISGPHGTHIEDAVIGAIRQQARDIAELRTENAAILAANRDMQMHFDAMQDDLAAAVAERDRLSAELSDSYKKLASVDIALDVAEARLAAIDGAPVVAVIHDSHGHLSVARAVTRLPDEGTELIARPAKDSKSTFEETARSIGIRFNDIENHENQT